MTPKAILRFAIGIVIAAILLTIFLPLIGVPRAELVPPFIAYSSASSKTRGVITEKHDGATANPFRVGDKVYYVSYQFQAIAPPLLFDRTGVGKPKTYKGMITTDASTYDTAVIGAGVPIKYEKTYPEISGINVSKGGQNTVGGSAFFGIWIFWVLLTITIGYFFGPLIERVALRENF